MNKLQSFELSKGITDLIVGMETDLIANIAAYLAAGKIDEPTAQWKIKKLAELGKLTKANAKTIAEYAEGVPELLDVTLKRAAINAIQEFEPGLKRLVEEGLIENRPTPPAMSEGVKRVLSSLKKQARKDLNLVNTRMRIEAKNTAMKVINRTAERAEKQEYINMLNKAAGKVVTGVEARQAALRECIAEMTEKGIPAFTDSAGRKWTPEAYVNMCIRSTVNNVTAETQFAKMDDYDLDLIEVSSHNGARPRCAKDQGKIFSRKNRSGYTTDLNGKRVRFYSWRSSSYGKPDGILGINCGHHITPFLQGISVQTYFPYDEEENAAQYKKIQEQRRLEREVRKSKRECSSLAAIDDKEGFDKAAYKLKQKEQRLKQHCNDNGLTYHSDRTATPGYGRSEASKVTAGYKRELKKEESQLIKMSDSSKIYSEFNTTHERVDKSDKSDIIKISSIFAKSESNLSRNGKLVKPIDGYTDIICHGSADNLVIEGLDGEEWKYNAKQAAEIIRNSREFTTHKKIRLISCNTGEGKEPIAQLIADELGVEVIAPNESIYINSKGELFITNNQVLADLWNSGESVKETGKWIKFIPRKK